MSKINRFKTRYAAREWARGHRLMMYSVIREGMFYVVYVPITEHPLARLYETLTANHQDPSRFKSRYYALNWAREYEVRNVFVKSYKVNGYGVRYAVFIPADSEDAVKVYTRLIKECLHERV